MDKRIFKRSEVDVNRRQGWVADLNDPQSNTITEDAYWYFGTRKAAERFVELIDEGVDPALAIEYIKPGRPPLHGETMRQTALYLTAEQIAWLKAQPGTLSETVRRLIDAAMEVTVLPAKVP